MYDREKGKVLTFSDTMKGTKEGLEEEIALDEPRIDEVLDADQKEQLVNKCKDRNISHGTNLEKLSGLRFHTL